MNEKRVEEPVGSIRDSDVDPYTALRWVGTLFKAAAVFLLVAVIGEFIAGLREGVGTIPHLLGELARTGVLAVVLWGGGDLVRLLIRLGNDVRTERILLSRLLARTPTRKRSRSVRDRAPDAVPVDQDEESDAGRRSA